MEQQEKHILECGPAVNSIYVVITVIQLSSYNAILFLSG